LALIYQFSQQVSLEKACCDGYAITAAALLGFAPELTCKVELA
jgi:hypothetical protein